MKNEALSKKINCILLVEDNEFINIFNRRIIEQLAVTNRIEVVESGQHGIDYLSSISSATPHTQVPDMILLDLNMPRMNGWEFINEYRKIKNNIGKDIVIVVLSTSPNPDDIKRSEQIPEISAFVSKPLTKDVLEKLVNKYF